MLISGNVKHCSILVYERIFVEMQSYMVHKYVELVSMSRHFNVIVFLFFVFLLYCVPIFKSVKLNTNM